MSRYNSYIMDELVNTLSNEPDPDRFVEAAKVFVQKFVDGNYIPRSEWEIKMEDTAEASFQEGFDSGYKEGLKDVLDVEEL